MTDLLGRVNPINSAKKFCKIESISGVCKYVIIFLYNLFNRRLYLDVLSFICNNFSYKNSHAFDDFFMVKWHWGHRISSG